MILVAGCVPYRKMGDCKSSLVAVWDADAGPVGVIMRGSHDRCRGHNQWDGICMVG